MGSQQENYYEPSSDSAAASNDSAQTSSGFTAAESNFGNPAALYQQGLDSGVLRG